MISPTPPLLLACLTLLPIAVPHAAAHAAAITDDQVDEAIRRAVAFLWSRQGADGAWREPAFEGQYPGGVTALAAFALRTAGEGVSKPGMQKAITVLDKLYEKNDVQTVYVRSFTLMLWCALDPDKYRRRIHDDVTYLVREQKKHGAWGYGRDPLAPDTWTDHSNSQLAILALWEAANARGEVPRSTWQQAASDWLESQLENGGWDYPATPNLNIAMRVQGARGSMTAAGLATLYILYDQLFANAEGAYKDGLAPSCGMHQPRTRGIERALERAWGWMNKNFTVERHPGLIEPQWYTYYLYSVERAGVASGYKYFGEQPWYRSIAERLVLTQSDDGSWSGVYQTAFALLALSKGRAVIAFNKLKYEAGAAAEGAKSRPKANRAEDWNNDPRDVAALTHWLARRFESGLTWQTVELRESEESLRDAPVLYISGHEGPQWTPVQQQMLQDYVWSGGTILAVACCNRSAFVERATEQFDRMFPRLTRGVVAADHPIWSILDKLDADKSVIGYADGCRTSIFVVTRGVCCAWQQNLFVTQAREFQLASNILLYATNRAKLRQKLAPLFVAPRNLFGGKRIRVGRLHHDGDFWSDPFALRRASDVLIDRAGLGIDELPDVDLAGAPPDKLDALFMTGHTAFSLTDAQRRALRQYLDAGGTLIATAACGRAPFDDAFRKLIAVAFASDALVPIPPDDALCSARLAPGAYDLHDMHYKRTAARGRFEPTPAPQLFGVRIKDRWAVIYSPLDLSCGLVGHECYECAGYTSENARAIAVNCLLYASRRRP